MKANKKARQPSKADLADKHGGEARKLFRETFTPEENASRLVNAVMQWTVVKQGEGIQ